MGENKAWIGQVLKDSKRNISAIEPKIILFHKNVGGFEGQRKVRRKPVKRGIDFHKSLLLSCRESVKDDKMQFFMYG